MPYTDPNQTRQAQLSSMVSMATNPLVTQLSSNIEANKMPYLTFDNKGLTTDPSMIQTTFGSPNGWNTFRNTMSQMGLTSARSRLRDINKVTDQYDEEIDNLTESINKYTSEGDIFKAEFAKQELKKKQEEKGKFSTEKQSEVDDLNNTILEKQKAIDARPVDLDYQIKSQFYQQDEWTNPVDYTKYEMGQELGSSIGMISSQMLATFGPGILKGAVKRYGTKFLANEAAGSIAPGAGNIIAGVATVGMFAADLAALYASRKNETESEMDDAWQQSYGDQKSSYMAKNQLFDDSQLETPEHQKALRQIRLNSDKGLEELRSKNMGLMLGDVVEAAIAITPYSKVFEGLLGASTRAGRTIAKSAAFAYTMRSESNEEGSQWLWSQQYLDKVLHRDPRFKDVNKVDYNQTGNYKDKLENLLSDRFEVEKAMYGYGDPNLNSNLDFRNSARSGLTVSLMMGAPHIVSMLSDHYAYNRSKNELSKLAEEESNLEHLKFKYDTYEKYLTQDRNINESTANSRITRAASAIAGSIGSVAGFSTTTKADYFEEIIKNFGKNKTHGFDEVSAAKEISKFKRARELYEKIDAPTYLGGVLETFDFRGIDRVDRKKAVKNILMIEDINEQISEIQGLKSSSLFNNRNEKIASPVNKNKKGDKLVLSTWDKVNDYLTSPDETLLDNFDIKIGLKERGIERLEKELKSISTGEYSKTRRKYENLAKNGTALDRSVLAYRFGNTYTSHPHTELNGEEDYVNFLADQEHIQNLVNKDKTNWVKASLENEAPIADIASKIRQADIKLDAADHAEVSNRLSDEVNKSLSEASKIQDSEGDTSTFSSIDELQYAVENALVADYPYAEELKNHLFRAIAFKEAHTDFQDNKDHIISDYSEVKTDKKEKEKNYIKERYLDPINAEAAKIENDIDAIDFSLISSLQNKIQWLKDVLNSHKQLETNGEYKDVKDSINSTIKRLEDLEKLLRKRLADKELIQEASYTRNTTTHLASVGIEYTPSDNIAEVLKHHTNDNAKATDPILRESVITWLSQFLVKDSSGKYFLHQSYAQAAGEILVKTANIEDCMLAKGRAIETIILKYVQLISERNGNQLSPDDPAVQYRVSVYMNNPQRGFMELLPPIFRDYTDSGPMADYMATFDSTEFNKIEGTLDPEEAIIFKDFVKQHKIIQDLHNIILLYDRKDSIIKTLENEIKIFENSDIIPTKQQLMALRQLVGWFYSDSSEERAVDNKSLASLLGYAGAGKTQVALNFFIKALNLKADDIYAFAPTLTASRTLAQSLGLVDVDDPTPVKTFLKGDNAELAKNKLIVIDEAGLITNTIELSEVVSKIEDLRAINPQIKVLMLGDPTQFSASRIADFIGLAHLTPAMDIVEALTVSYRSNDVDINLLQKEFKNKTTLPKTVKFSCTKDGLYGTKGLVDVDSLIKELRKNTNNGRSKVLIVNDETEKAKLEAILKDNDIKDVEVLHFKEAQSITRDEAYVLLDPSGELNPDHRTSGLYYGKYNKAMYVATSRAMKLAVVVSSDFTVVNSEKTLLPEESKQEYAKEQHDTFINELKEQYKNLTEIEPPAKLNTGENQTTVDVAPDEVSKKNTTAATDPEVPKDSTDKDSSTDASKDAEKDINGSLKKDNNITVDEGKITNALTGEVHNIKYPQYTSVSKSKDQSTKVKVGSKVIYVKTRYTDSKTKKTTFGVNIIHILPNGHMVLIGMISKDEVSDKGSKFKIPEEVRQHLLHSDWDTYNNEKVMTHPFGKEGITTGNKVPYLPKGAILAVGTITKASPKNIAWGSLKALGHYIKNLHAKIVNDYLISGNTSLESIELGSIDKHNLVIYNSKQIKDQGIKGVRPGITYFKFAIGYTSGKEEVFHYPLTRRKLSKVKDENLLKPLRTLLDLAKDLENTLSKIDNIKWGGNEVLDNHSVTTKEGEVIHLTQSEVFSKFLSSRSAKHKELMSKLQDAGVNTNEVLDKIKQFRDLIYQTTNLENYGFNEKDPGINLDPKKPDAGFINKFMITGEKGSREVIPGDKTIGDQTYTENPEMPGFYKIKKSDKGEFWRKLYQYKGLHVKIDVNCNTGQTDIQVHNQEMVAKNGRIISSIKKDGTMIFRGSLNNTKLGPENYINDKIDDGDITDATDGPASKAFKLLTTANSNIVTPNGRHWLRVTRQDSETHRQFFTGISLLHTVGVQTTFNKNRGRATSYFHTNRAGEVEIYESQPITSDLLEDMVGDSSFNTSGESVANGMFGLRIPTSDNEINPTQGTAEEKTFKQQQLIDNNEFEVSVEGINPTEITISGINKYTGEEVKDSVDTKEETTTTEPIVTEAPAREVTEEDTHLPEEFNGWSIGESDEDMDYTSDRTLELSKNITKNEAIRLAKKIFGKNFNPQTQLFFVTASEMRELFPDKERLGRFYKGAMYVVTNTDGSVKAEILRHEAFHKVLAHFMTPSQQEYILDLARSLDSSLLDKTNKQVNEWLANKFQKFNQDRSFVDQKLHEFFSWLKQVFGFLLSNREKLESMFYQIERGEYQEVNQNSILDEESMDLTRIRETFGSPNKRYSDAVDNYLKAKHEILKTLQKFIFPNTNENGIFEGIKTRTNLEGKKIISNIPLTPHEALERIREQLLIKANNITKEGQELPNWLRRVLYKDAKSDIFKEMYESLITVPSVEFDSDNSLDDIQDSSLKDELLESYRINYENSLLSNVRNYLTTIFTSNDELVNMRHAFLLAIKMLSNIDFNDSHNNIKEQITYLGKKAGAESNEKTMAVRNRLLEMMDLAFNDTYNYTDNKGKKHNNMLLPSNVQFGEYGIRIVDKEGKEVYTLRRIKTSNNAASDFIIRAAADIFTKKIELENNPKASVEQIINVLTAKFIQQQSSDVVRGLQVGLGSLIKRHPMIATLEVKEDTSDEANVFRAADMDVSKLSIYRYKDVRMVGGEEAVNLNLQDRITRIMFSTDTAAKIKHLIKISEAKKEHLGAVQEIFRELVIPKYQLIKLTEETAKELLTNFNGIFKALTAQLANDSLNKDNVLEDLQNYKNEIVDIISSTEDFAENTSYIDGRNQKNYLYVPGSWLTRTYNRIKAAETNKSFKVPEYLNPKSTSFIFFRHNPFANKNAKLRKIMVHDSTKVFSREYDMGKLDLRYKDEKLSGFTIRNVIYLFATTLNNKKNEGYYGQSTYVHSNKPQAFAFLIKLLNQAGLKEYTKKALLQQGLRSDYYKELEKQGITLKNVNSNTVDHKPGFVSERITKGMVSSEESLEAKTLEVLNNINEDALKAYKYLRDNEAFSEKLEYYDREKTDHLGRIAEETVANLLRLGVITEEDLNKYRAIVKNHIMFSSEEKKNTVQMEDEAKKLAVFTEFYKQDYINGHFVNQLFMGDIAQYKNKAEMEDLIKRASGTISPGLLGLSNDVIGMRTHMQIAVMADESKYFTKFNDYARGLEAIYGSSFDRTDAQMWYLPEWGEELRKGYSSFYKVGNVVKPVLDFINDKGIRIYSKNSGRELTDALCAAFPELNQLREELREYNNNNPTNPIMELHSVSAVKLGCPKIVIDPNQSLTAHFKEHGNASLINVPTQYYSIQSNPRAKESDITGFSQLTFFLNTNTLNKVTTDLVYELDAKIASLNFDKFKKELGIKKSPTGDYTINEESLRRVIAKSIGEIPGSERYYDLLTQKDEKGKYIIALSFPAIRDRVGISLISKAAKNSVKSTTNTGTKLVLQSAKGGDIFRIGNDIKTYNELSTEDKIKADAFYNISSYRVQKALKVKFNSYHITGDLKAWETNKKKVQEYFDTTMKDSDREYIDSINENSPMLVPTKLNIITSKDSYDTRIAEIVAPAWWLTKHNLNNGQLITPDDFLTRFGFAVRIPTTGIHSAVVYKIVGSLKGDDNVVIAPEELVALHGSDFDVDSLFAIRPEILTDDTGKLIGVVNAEGKTIIEEGQRLGWLPTTLDENGKHTNLMTSYKDMMFTQDATETIFAANEFERQLKLYKSEIEKIDTILKTPEKLDKETLRSYKGIKNNLEKAIILTLKNYKSWTTSYILLSRQNTEDMLQPITFDAIKQDFLSESFEFFGSDSQKHKLFEKDKASDFLKAALKNNLEMDFVKKFKEWGITYNNVDKVISIDTSKNTIKITDSKIKEKILADKSISVVTMLRLVTGKNILKDVRNINRFEDKVKFYVDNFAGVSLTGAFANFVKALAYIKFASPNDTHLIGVDEKQITIKYDNEDYSILEQREKADTWKGRTIWEIYDTLINGAIDNVKEQVLEIINATNNTGALFCTLLTTGLPLNDVVLLMRQPIMVKEFNSSRNTKSIKLKLETELGKRLINKDTKGEVTSIELATALGENQTDYTKLTNASLLVQYKTLNIMLSIQEASNAISNTASALNVLRDFEPVMSKVEEVEDKIEKAYQYSGFKGTDFSKVPHIQNAVTSFNDIIGVWRTTSKFYSTKLKEKVDKAVEGYLDKVDSSSLRLALSRYIISAVNTSPLDLVWRAPLIIKNLDGTSKSVDGTTAWLENFAMLLEKTKLESANLKNIFLNGLDVKQNKKTGLREVKWVSGNNTNESTVSIGLQNGFDSLQQEMKEQIVKFAALDSGMEFGIKSFSSLLAPSFLGALSRHYDSILSTIIDTEAFENFSDDFIINYIRTNPNAAYNMKSESMQKKYGQTSYTTQEDRVLMGYADKKSITLTINNNITVVDPKTKESRVIVATSPKLVSYEGSLYVKVVEDTASGLSGYASIGSSEARRFYSFNPSIVTEGYNIQDHYLLDHKVYYAPSAEIGKDIVIITKSYELKVRSLQEGEKVYLRSNSDMNSTKSVLYKVDKVEKAKEKVDNGYVYEVKTTLSRVNTTKSIVEAKEQRTTTSKEATLKTLTHLIQKLQKVMKLNVNIIDFTTSELVKERGISPTAKGFYLDGKVYLNLNSINLETPIHEFGHALLLIVKQQNKALYNNLVNQIKDSSIFKEIQLQYPDLSIGDQIDEAIVTAIGRHGVGMIDSFSTKLLTAIKRIYDFLVRFITGINPTVSIGKLDEKSSIADLAGLLLDERELNDLTTDLTGFGEFRGENPTITIERQAMVESTDGKSYSIITPQGTTSVKRVSEFLTSFNPFPEGKTPAEYKADRYFKQLAQPKDTGKITIDSRTGKEYTYNEAVKEFERRGELARLAGKLIHAALQEHLTKDTDPMLSTIKTNRGAYQNSFIKMGGDEFLVNNLTSEWLDMVCKHMNITSDDEVYSELGTYNKEFGIGGTIDILVKHKDGTFSLFDIKTGRLDDRRSIKMNYADNIGLEYNSLNRNSLQLMSYAMLLKSKYPNMRFRNITLINANPNRSNATINNYHVNRGASLTLLKEYYRRNNPDLIKDRKNWWVFDHKEYLGGTTTLASDFLTEKERAGKNADIFEIQSTLLNKYYRDLSEIRKQIGKADDPEDYIASSISVRKKEEEILAKIAELQGTEFGHWLDNQKDMTSTEALTSVGFNVKNPLVKLFIKLYQRAQVKSDTQRSQLHEKHNQLMKDVMKEYYGQDGMSDFLRKITLGLINPMDYEKVFSFMWKERANDAVYTLTEEDPEFKTLSIAKQQYNVFYREGLRDSLFAALSTERGSEYYKKKLKEVKNDLLLNHSWSESELKAKYESKIKYFESLPKIEKWKDELGNAFNYTEDFSPRMPKITGETKGIKEYLTKAKRDAWGTFQAFNYKQKDKDLFGLKPIGVPIKYMASAYAYGKNQTMHSELLFKAFTQNMIDKIYQDDTAVYGQALSDVLKYGGEEIEKQKNTAKFVEDYVKNNIADMHSEKKDFETEFKVFGRTLSSDKAIRWLLGTATVAKLTFSTMGAFRNFVLNQLNLTKDAIKGSIAKRSGIDPKDIDWSLSDLIDSYGIWTKHLINKMTGVKDKWAYLNERHDFTQQQFYAAHSKEHMVAAKNKIWDQKWLYMTYGLGDNLAYSIATIASLRKMKNQKTGQSLWDSYNDKGEWIGGVRGRLEDGDLLEGLSSHEIIYLKKISSRVFGEYDKRMKRGMESNAVTMSFLQFKKYLPNYIERGWQGKSGEFENASLGKFVEVLEAETGKQIIDKEGNPLYQWESRLDRGHIYPTLNIISDLSGVRNIKMMVRSLYGAKALVNDAANGGREWSKLSNEQKQHVISALLTWAFFLAITATSIMAYGDQNDDDKDPMKNELLQLRKDMTIEMNIIQLLKIANKPTVLLPQLLEFSEGSWNLMTKGMYEGKKQKDGSIPGLKGVSKSLPFSNFYYQNVDKPWWEDTSKN